MIVAFFVAFAVHSRVPICNGGPVFIENAHIVVSCITNCTRCCSVIIRNGGVGKHQHTVASLSSKVIALIFFARVRLVTDKQKQVLW